MKRIRYFLCMALLLVAWSANAQLFVDYEGIFFIKTGTPIAMDSLYMVPSTDVTLSDITIRKADTSLIGLGGESLRRVYFFSSPVSYTGSVGFQYRNSELNGNHESGLNFSHHGAGTNLTNTVPFLYDTVSNFIRQDYADTIDLSVVTAVDPAVVLALNGVWFDSVTSESMRLRFRKGIGTGRIVVMKKLTQVNKPPHDNTNYTANATFGLGSDILGGNFVVYNGTGDSVTIVGLEPGNVYHAAVFEYTTKPGKINYRSGRKASDTTLNDFVNLATAGKPYRQHFDDSLLHGEFPVGWTSSHAFQPDDGSSASAGIKNFGNTGSTDLALGSVAGGGEVFGAKFVNKSGKVLTSVLLKYSMEQWRKGGTSSASAPDSLIVEYSVNAGSITDGAATWQGIAVLGTSSAVTGATAGALDGNLPQNRKQVEGSITGISVGTNAALWIRFRDFDLPGGADDGLAVDDIDVVPFSTTLLNGGIISNPSYNDLNIVSGSVTVNSSSVKFTKALNISKNAVLNLNTAPGKSLLIYGDLYGTGTISAPVGKTGIVTVGGNGLNQKLYFTPGLNTIASLNIRPSANAGLGNELNMTAGPKGGQVKIGTDAGDAIFNSNGFLTLRSDTVSSATISEVFGSIKGAVNIERALQSRAGIRLISNPFKDAISVHQLKDDISLDVSGGAGQNSWYYDQFAANPPDISALAGTSSWTNITGDSAIWSFGPLRLSKPAGPLTVDFSGEVNQGDVHMPVNGGSGNYVVLGNPYPATIGLGPALADGIAAGAILPTAIYSWNPAIGSQGGFVTIPNSKFNTARVPICGSFVVLVAPGHNGFLDFMEMDKITVGSTSTYFRPGNRETVVDGNASGFPEGMELVVERDGNFWDGTYVYFDAQAVAGSNTSEDAPKIDNPALNLYTTSVDGARLSVDKRPFENGSRIPLAISRASVGDYLLKVAEMNLPKDKEVYLIDSYTATERLLEPNSAYGFSVAGDAGSQGEQRFYLRMGPGSQTHASSFSIDVTPNPAIDQITVSTNSSEEGQMGMRLLSVTGQEVLTRTVYVTAENRHTLSVAGIPAGAYILEVKLNGYTSSKKFIKQ